jgi:tricorn protease
MLAHLFVLTLSCVATVLPAPGGGTRLLHEPDISSDRIVFSYAGDLWTSAVSGGEARRLTAHLGDESSPKFSPDGRWIAFTGEYDGNSDVYVISALGGEPRRLTFHPGSDVVLSWSPDGTKVMFRSNRYAFNRFSQFFTVSVDGGFEQLLPIPEGSLGSFSPDGRQIAYTPISNAFQVWKRYRGGRTTPIWLIDLQSHDHVEIPHQNASDTYPLWLGDAVYFLSDRNGVMNLFAYDVRSKQVRQLVQNGTTDIKYLSGGAGKLIYESDGYLHVLDPRAGTPQQVAITVPSDLVAVRTRYENVSSTIRSFDISPTGQRALFEARGDILTAPAKNGDIRNITQTPGAYERDPAWSPDGRYITYFSDVDGEYALYLADPMGTAPAKKIAIANPTFFYRPVWSPDSKNILFSDKAGNLSYVDVATGKLTKIDTQVGSRSYDWSPDGRWVSYTPSLDNRFRVVKIYSLETGRSHQVTDGMSDAQNPVFSRDGKYLYFLASDDIGPTKGGLDLSSTGREVTWSMFLAVLRNDLPSPFAPQSDEERPRTAQADTPPRTQQAEEQTGNQENPQAERRPAPRPVQPVRIDVDGIDQRILSMQLPAGSYSDLQAADGERLFFRSGNVLRRYDMRERRAEDFMTGVSGYSVSADGRQLLYRAGQNWGIVPTNPRPQPNAGRIDVSAMEVLVDPVAEWKQMFVESWRINRDFFYDPSMHGLDWKAVRAQYETWLPDVKHRSDLNYVIGEMLGELSVGHSRVGGGDMGVDVERVGGGLLGADYEIVGDRYRIRKIYSGQNWSTGLRAPLTAPGVNVKEGDYILRVNGRELKHPVNIYSLFEKTANRQIALVVSPTPNEADGRTVVVVPVASENNLRNRDWVESNRKKVEQLSGGKVGYIYLPDTGNGGFDAFNQGFFAQTGKEGLVIDERYNGGGKAADYVVDYLSRPLMSYWAPRDGPDYTTPFAANFGPKAMIINEYAGSGGDAMPFYFSLRKIGPLVGKRTWGGLVGIGGTPNLLDGGSVTAPSFAIFSKDGEWIIENEGVPPDVEVEMTPKLVNQGKDPQLERAVQLVLDQLAKGGYKATPRPAYPDKTLKKVSTTQQNSGR